MSETRKKTTKKQKDVVISCKSCGQVINPTETPPSSTWNLTSPLPDKEGRITLTVMGSFTCPRCGKNVKAAMMKIKSDDELSGKSKKELLLDLLREQTSDVSVEELAEQLNMSASSIEKAVQLLVKKGDVKGKVENGMYKV